MLFYNNLKRIRVYLFKYETPVLKNLITFDIHIKKWGFNQMTMPPLKFKGQVVEFEQTKEVGL